MSEDIVKADTQQVTTSEQVAEMETESEQPSAMQEDKLTPLTTPSPLATPASQTVTIKQTIPAALPKPANKENKQTTAFKKPMEKKSQLSPEKLEEAKLNAKYGKMKPGGSDFLRKRLNKGVKYFDSGDYNMKLKPNSSKPPGIAGPGIMLGQQQQQQQQQQVVPSPVGGATGKTIPTPASIPHRKQSTEISKLAV